MSILRNFEYYKEEIELALIQNAGVEIELYSIVASMIRESPNTSPLSIRDVSARRKSDISMKFYGQAGFPDFVVLAREKDSNAKLYGCIEAAVRGCQVRQAAPAFGQGPERPPALAARGFLR